MESGNATHTPGRWRVGDAGATVFGPPNGNPAPEIIATVRRKANARLIAAAPDLLAALERLCNYVSVAPPDSTGQAMVKLRAAAIDEARAIIRTAKVDAP